MKRELIVFEKKLAYRYEDSGTFCFVIKDKELIKKFTDREEVVVKVFFKAIDETREYTWGHDFDIIRGDKIYSESSVLSHATIIQSWFSHVGLAPKVYEFGAIQVLETNSKYPFQIVEDLSGLPIETDPKKKEKVFYNIAKIAEKVGVNVGFIDMNDGNIIDGKLIDWQGFSLNVDKAIEKLKEDYVEKAVWNGNTYQTLDLSFYDKGIIEGYRKDHRSELLEDLGEVLFKDQVVYDIGCNGGEFTRLAEKFGAKRCVAFDFEDVLFAAKRANSFLHVYNVDYISDASMNFTHSVSPDTILFLSMTRHVGLPDILFQAKRVVYEHNGDKPFDEIQAEFEEKGFLVTNDFGVTGDHDDRNMVIFTHKSQL